MKTGILKNEKKWKKEQFSKLADVKCSLKPGLNRFWAGRDFAAGILAEIEDCSSGLFLVKFSYKILCGSHKLL